MAYIDYPIKCIAADSYRENPERGSTLHRAEDGTPWVVNLWPETRYTFEITHPALSAEEQLELEQFYDQHIGDEVGWDNPRRQERWIVRMVGPPRLASMRDGMRGDVEMTLVGYRGVAPTNSVPPVVSGLHQIGQVISVSQGTWQSEYPMQFEYQWLRNGEPIAGATDQNYTLVDDDLFNMISVRVTASSLGGSTSVETDPVLARLDSAVSWLYSDMAETIFVDTSGNNPATWGDPVGLVKDSSGNGNDFTQPTVTARPILGRVPRGGRTNWLQYTEEFDNPYWANLGGLFDVAPATDPYEGECFRVKSTGDSQENALGTKSFVRANERVFAYFDIKPISDSGVVQISLRGTRPTNTALHYNFDGTFTSGTPIGAIVHSASPESLSGGWVRLHIEYTVINPSNSNTCLSIGMGPPNNATEIEFLLKRAKLGYGSSAPYQRVTTDYDITESGVPDVYYLNFDGTDDLISTEIPAIENGTLVIAGTNGIWIDDDYNFDGGTFSIGPTSYPGGPEGILTAIGEPIVGGFLVINRQLSQLERELVVEELKERGAPGVFELGPELALVSEYEGTPITDPGDSTIDGIAVIATSLLAGDTYRISYDITGYDGANTVGCGGPAQTGQSGAVRQNSNGSYTVLLTPTQTGDMYLFTRRQNTATFTNVSIRQLELIP